MQWRLLHFSFSPKADIGRMVTACASRRPAEYSLMSLGRYQKCDPMGSDHFADICSHVRLADAASVYVAFLDRVGWYPQFPNRELLRKDVAHHEYRAAIGILLLMDDWRICGYFVTKPSARGSRRARRSTRRTARNSLTKGPGARGSHPRSSRCPGPELLAR